MQPERSKSASRRRVAETSPSPSSVVTCPSAAPASVAHAETTVGIGSPGARAAEPLPINGDHPPVGALEGLLRPRRERALEVPPVDEGEDAAEGESGRGGR